MAAADHPLRLLIPMLQNPRHHQRHCLPKLTACMPRLLLDEATSLEVAGEALYLDSVEVEEASPPTPIVPEEEGEVGSVGGVEDLLRLPCPHRSVFSTTAVFVGSSVSGVPWSSLCNFHTCLEFRACGISHQSLILMKIKM